MSRGLIAIHFVALCFSSLYTEAQASSAYLGPRGTRAVDIKGVRHDGDNYPKGHPPWLDDIEKAVAPDYPDWDRARRHEGAGWFQLTLDQKTGAVTKVAVIKSTGFSTLDKRAIDACRQWRWKPGKWKEIDMPVTFRLANTSKPPPLGSRRLPPR